MFRNLLIVEEHHFLSDSIAWILSDAGLAFSYIPVNSLSKAETVFQQTTIDLVIIDLNLPEPEIKLFCRTLKDSDRSLKTVVITSTPRKGVIQKMIHPSIDALLLRSDYTAELVDAVNEVIAGGRYICKGVHDILNGMKVYGYHILTKREKEILTLIAEGHTNTEISKKLFISHFTVDSHRKNLLSKFNTKNTATLIRKAIILGIIE